MELKHNSKTVSIWINDKPLIILSNTDHNISRLGELYDTIKSVSNRLGVKPEELKLTDLIL